MPGFFIVAKNLLLNDARVVNHNLLAARQDHAGGLADHFGKSSCRILVTGCWENRCGVISAGVAGYANI